jgi:acyl-CoA dehydrogenase
MTENELYGLAVKLFEEHRDAEPDGWAPNLWKALQQTGFSDVPIPEDLGGAGGSVADAVQLLRATGAQAAPVPLAEAGLIGGWLLASVSIPMPNGIRTVLPPGNELRLDGDRLSGTASAIPWGRNAEHVVGLVDGTIVLAPGPAQPNGPAVSFGTNIADEPRDTVVFDGVRVAAHADAPDDVTEETLWERTALGRVALMTGAVGAIATMTLRYSGEREQFGRPINRFQAVQAHLVHIHQQATVLESAIDGAVEAVELGRGGFEIACAKLLADRAAQLVTAAAHQTHGAIGMTKEYPLHYLTRRLWAWRDEAGGHQHWASRLGAALVAQGPDALYPAIQSGSELVQ